MDQTLCLALEAVKFNDKGGTCRSQRACVQILFYHCESDSVCSFIKIGRIRVHTYFIRFL